VQQLEEMMRKKERLYLKIAVLGMHTELHYKRKLFVGEY
jgi:hypothetical protein